MTHSVVTIQITPKSVPSTPSWMGEVGAVAQVLSPEGILKALQEHVRFARARIGHDDLIDFAVVLIGYTLSGAPTLKAFSEQLLQFAEVFMALFGRHHLPDRSTLSRLLAALDQPTLEALRTLFEQDLVKRTSPATSPGGFWDRLGNRWLVVDVDATKQAVRQRALPQLKSHPSPHRRFEQVAAPGSSSTQKRRSGKDSDHHLTSLSSSMERNVCWPRKWRLSRRQEFWQILCRIISIFRGSIPPGES